MQAEYLSAVPAMEEALPDVLMRIVSELHDVAYLIERIEPQLAGIHGDAVLDADLDFEGGVTGETLLRFLKIFSDSVEAFSEHLD